MSANRLLIGLAFMAVIGLSVLYFSVERDSAEPDARGHASDLDGGTTTVSIGEGLASQNQTRPQASPTSQAQADAQQPPDAELRSAVVDACENPAEQSSEAAEETGTLAERMEQKREQARAISNALRVSSSGENLHVAALFEDSAEERIALLRRSLAMGGANRFLAWAAVLNCSDSRKASVNCPLQEWEARLLQFDGQNSEAWVLLAANRFRSGDYDAALVAMKHASTAAESRAYWTDMITMFERGLSAATDKAFSERASLAFGFAASNTPHYGLYVKMCSDRSKVNVEWAYTCLAYGRLVEKQGKNAMLVAISQAIQKESLEALGELEEAGRIENLMAARRQEQRLLIDNYNPAVERVLVSSPALFYSLLDAIDADGETVAMADFNERVTELLLQEPECIQ